MLPVTAGRKKRSAQVFRRRGTGNTVTVYIDGIATDARAGETVAALLLTTSDSAHRSSVVSAAPRAPYCMMGVCFECLVEIDGIPYQQACMIPVAAGMRVRRQHITQTDAWC